MIELNGFRLAKVDSDAEWYYLTFRKSVEEIQDNVPSVVKYFNTDDGKIVGEMQEAMKQAAKSYITEMKNQIPQLMVKPQRYQEIHMHLLKSENTWIKDLHIDHSVDVKLESAADEQ